MIPAVLSTNVEPSENERQMREDMKQDAVETLQAAGVEGLKPTMSDYALLVTCPKISTEVRRKMLQAVSIALRIQARDALEDGGAAGADAGVPG